MFANETMCFFWRFFAHSAFPGPVFWLDIDWKQNGKKEEWNSPHVTSSLAFDLFLKHDNILNIDIWDNIKLLYEAKEEAKICILRR